MPSQKCDSLFHKLHRVKHNYMYMYTYRNRCHLNLYNSCGSKLLKIYSLPPYKIVKIRCHFFPCFSTIPPDKRQKNVSHHIISPAESSHPPVKPWLFASNLQGVALCLSKAWLKKKLKQKTLRIRLLCFPTKHSVLNSFFKNQSV